MTIHSFILLLSFLASFQSAHARGVTSKLQVQIPLSLRKDGGYEHFESQFGKMSRAGHIEEMVYYTASPACDSRKDYRLGTYPTINWKMPVGVPFILMVDRGDCSFVQSVRNAQRSGALAVIIADTKCLCGAPEGSCVPADPNNSSCQATEPHDLLVDDGSGSDITIPSVLISREDAIPLIKRLKEEDRSLRVKFSWSLPSSEEDIVHYELWSTPSEIISLDFQKNFTTLAVALGDRAKFTPRFYIYSGTKAHCRVSGYDFCSKECSNHGRYCSPGPYNKLHKNITGSHVMTESLRRMCIWKVHGDDGIGLPWWKYIDQFHELCDPARFSEKKCIDTAMLRSGVNPSIIESCMSDSGGYRADQVNAMLESEMEARERSGISVLPTLSINSIVHREKLTVREVFVNICNIFLVGPKPKVCELCSSCLDPSLCASTGRCTGADAISNSVSVGASTSISSIVNSAGGSSNGGSASAASVGSSGGSEGISRGGFVLGMMVTASALSVISVYFIRRTQREARDITQEIVAQYIPLDGGENEPPMETDEQDDPAFSPDFQVA